MTVFATQQPINQVDLYLSNKSCLLLATRDTATPRNLVEYAEEITIRRMTNEDYLVQAQMAAELLQTGI